MGLNGGGKLTEPLTLIYPKEGIITADYPFMLLNEAKRDAYDKVVGVPANARRAAADHDRHGAAPAVPGIPLDRASPTPDARRAAVPVQARRRSTRCITVYLDQIRTAGVGDLRARQVGLDAGRAARQR